MEEVEVMMDVTTKLRIGEDGKEERRRIRRLRSTGRLESAEATPYWANPMTLLDDATTWRYWKMSATVAPEVEVGTAARIVLPAHVE